MSFVTHLKIFAPFFNVLFAHRHVNNFFSNVSHTSYTQAKSLPRSGKISYVYHKSVFQACFKHNLALG